MESPKPIENILETDRFGSIFWKECLDLVHCKEETDRFGSIFGNTF